MWKGIASSRRRTLSWEVAAGKKKSQQGQAGKGRETWLGIKRGLQTIPRRIKKKNMKQGIANSWQGTLSGEIKAGKTKMCQRRPQALWGFTEDHQGDLLNRRLRCQCRKIHKVQGKNHGHYTGFLWEKTLSYKIQ